MRGPMEIMKSRPGRPRKYSRPSRPITVTLPEDVIGRLSASDPDLGRAIVSLVEERGPGRGVAPHPAEVTNYGNHAVIIVTPLKALRKLPGVQLVPVGNGRALISLDSRNSIPRFELAVGDALESEAVSPAEREALEAVTGILQQARRSRGTTIEERTIIVLESKRRRRRP